MGAGLPNPFALVLLNSEAWARSQKGPSRDTLEKSLEAQLEGINRDLEAHERVAFLVVVEGPWTIENELITPTFKIRRAQLEQQYLGRVDDWYRQNRRVVWEGAGHATSERHVK